jgi:predicted SAM-dependent methyltransferase
MLGNLRERVRTAVPFSTDVYEYVDARRRMVASRRRVSALLGSGRELWLDLGGGSAGANGWLTVDMTRECDIFWDLRLGLPFPDGSVSRVYSSHFFEHLSFREGQAMLAECLRVLRPGGSFSICVPNAQLFVDGYVGARELPDELFGWEPAYNRTTSIDALNYIAYMGGEHKYMFDQENLLHILRTSGFDDVAARGFDPAVDMLERDHESIYASAVKPPA